jgi:predicted O-linked N-acetylglucosamine transferase (SPINDLY family)
MVLDVPRGKARNHLRDRLVSRGIDPDRVSIRGREAIVDYFAAIGNVDIALDTFPYNGGTTTFDTLWMGVPVVVQLGDRGVARSGYSVMQSLQMPELIATGADEYVAINVGLAGDFRWRSEFRKTLRQRLAASPLMDVSRFVADLEAGYREMWRTWCNG